MNKMENWAQIFAVKLFRCEPFPSLSYLLIHPLVTFNACVHLSMNIFIMQCHHHHHSNDDFRKNILVREEEVAPLEFYLPNEWFLWITIKSWGPLEVSWDFHFHPLVYGTFFLRTVNWKSWTFPSKNSKSVGMFLFLSALSHFVSFKLI